MVYLIIFLAGLLIVTFLKYQDYPWRLLEWFQKKNYRKEKLPELIWKSRHGNANAVAERLTHTEAKTSPTNQDIAEYRHDILNKFLNRITNFA